MLLSELSGKEIIDLQKAEKLGVLGQTDLEIDEVTGRIVSLIIPSGQRFGFRKRSSELRVPWSNIQKIGENMIMVDVPRINEIE